jgi:hypothetical protein
VNKVFLGSLLVSSVLLIGCETTPGGSTEERPFGTIFDAPTGVPIKVKIASVTQKNGQETDFSPKENVQESSQMMLPPGQSLDKKDLLYGFYNSGIVGEPVDFDNFFAEEGRSKAAFTTTFSFIDTNPNTSSNAIGDFFDSSTTAPVDFDNFFSDTGQSSLKMGRSNFDFILDAESQEKVDNIIKRLVATQKNDVIANQIRIKDADTQLITYLSNLEKDIPIEEKELAQTMKSELKHKIRLLDAETALKLAEIKMLASTKNNNVVARIEDKILSQTSSARKELITKMLVSESDNYFLEIFRLKEQGKLLEVKHQVEVAKIKLQHQKEIVVLKNNVKSLKVANIKIIDTRLAELEIQRIAEALIVKGEVKKKNQEIVNQSYPGLKAKISKYINTFEIKLSQREAFILDRLKEEYISKKSGRNSVRGLKNKRYIADINQQIEQEQKIYEDQSRDRLYSARDVKVNSIIVGHKRSVNRVESDGAKKLVALITQHAKGYEKQTHTLQAPYKKKGQVLNQKSQQTRSKVLSRFNSENYAIIAKENKETGVINREINARVKAEIKALLDSFEALKKEEAAKAKKISLEKPKESPGFFESLF